MSSDAFWKLNKDLTYLFSYQPSSTFSMPLTKLKELYKECYGYQLNPAVYHQADMESLLKHSLVAKVIKVSSVR